MIDTQAGRITLVAQQSTATVNRTTDSVTDVLLIVVPLMILLVGLAAWYFTGRALKPVEAIRQEAESITGDLSSELPGKRESMPGRRVMTVGKPGPTLAFRSVSGDLRVVQPREAAPAMAPNPPGVPQPPAASTPPTPPTPPAPPSAAPAAEVDAARLDILRELERGDITVAEATERLATLDEVPR